MGLHFSEAAVNLLKHLGGINIRFPDRTYGAHRHWLPQATAWTWLDREGYIEGFGGDDYDTATFMLTPKGKLALQEILERESQEPPTTIDEIEF